MSCVSCGQCVSRLVYTRTEHSSLRSVHCKIVHVQQSTLAFQLASNCHPLSHNWLTDWLCLPCLTHLRLPQRDFLFGQSYSRRRICSSAGGSGDCLLWLSSTTATTPNSSSSRTRSPQQRRPLVRPCVGTEHHRARSCFHLATTPHWPHSVGRSAESGIRTQGRTHTGPLPAKAFTSICPHHSVSHTSMSSQFWSERSHCHHVFDDILPNLL